jgi:biopolymer transport protein ExbD
MAVKLGGKKGEKYQLGQNADINVTPFVDVMLVLLIIFMVSIPMATVAIKIDLPPAINTPDNNVKPTYLSIGQDGRVILVDKGVDGSTLTCNALCKRPTPRAKPSSSAPTVW